MSRLKLDKSIQAAGVLLRAAPARRMSLLRMLKLLYMADREMLQQTGRPITFDRFVAMDHGPVLSGVYDLIKDTHIDSPQWSRYIERVDYLLHLRKDPGVGALSRREVETLESVGNRYRSMDSWQLVNRLHEELEEWKKNEPAKGSSTPIPISDVLAALGRDDWSEEVENELEEEARLDRFFDQD